MNACDNCIKPGSCCKGLHLKSDGPEVSFWSDEPRVAVLARMAEMGFPFVPTEVATRHMDPETDREFVTYRYDCPMLGEDGRCTIYEDRPMLCRSYEPKSDPLCIMHEAHA